MKYVNKRIYLNVKNIIFSFLFFTVFSGLYAQRNPIDINLIIDSSQSLANVKDDIFNWTFARLDQILVNGDKLTIWSAAERASVIYSGVINANEKDTVKIRISEISPSGIYADFTGALTEAASARSGASYSYTLLISASPDALTNTLSGSYANLLRFSRMEEFSAWRTLVVGLNIDAKVKSAAAAFFYN
ncbi:MAG: hypothetical protein LBG94_06335 [Treponema sp.]|jgi:hypothetical protein|nr:hypothetical protein [Treponema sp.]